VSNALHLYLSGHNIGKYSLSYYAIRGQRLITNILKAIVLMALSILFLTASGCVEKGVTAQMDTSKLITQKVHVNDIDIAYKEAGSGYPLVLIMGSGSSMDLWSPALISALAQEYRVIIFDNRGIGATTSSDREFSIKLFADDTAGLMDALKIEKANVLGWSMGTYIAQELVLNYPDKVNRVVLYAADAGGEKAVHSPDVIAQLNDTSGTDRDRGERLLKLMFPASWLKANPDPRKYMPIPAEQVLPESVKKQGIAIWKWAGTYDRLSRINVPVLLVVGMDDVIAAPQNSIMMVGQIPGAWLVQIKGGGHGLMFQYPERLVKIVSLFLAN
jgi:pimeloyl-ACP methyl ester carboxylesterase